ncbi:MAG: EAL domain-containing protein [Clostridia bacterium]|nr:EAL domain-containing protein [Clostridia bacterium]
MINGKRVIGVCMTKLHWSGRSEYLDSLRCYACENNFKLIIFNSFVDFYKNDENDQGACSIYDVINYDLVDALIIFDNSFNNKQLVHELAERAKAHHTPVIVLEGKCDGCFSINGDYDEAYESLMTHVIREHNARDTYFMAGRKEGDPTSQQRIECYRRALKTCGLPFEEERVGYGEFWSDPAKKIVQKMVESGKKLPDAIFCANDYMAIAVCDKLQEYGLRVPDDVIVTGFDGTDAARYAVPQITTCAEDQKLLARLSVETVMAALDGAPCCEVKNPFKCILTESCDCKQMEHMDFRDVAAQLHGQVDAVQMHEDYMYAWMNRMFTIQDMNGLYTAIAGSILENSYVCLNSDIIASITEGRSRQETQFTDQLVIISSRYTAAEKNVGTSFRLKDMVPGLESWSRDDTVFVLNSLYVGKMVCGFYAYRTDHLSQSAHKIKRIVNTVNLAFSVAISYYDKANLRLIVEKAALTNPVTHLPNLKGSMKWFQEFGTEENRKKTLCVSVYGMPKYAYIQDNYGIDAVEEAEVFVAEALKLANTDDCFIGHIADDEFLVINYFDPARCDVSTAISETIDRATSMFYKLVEEYNGGSGKEYYVEVNCGCSPVDAGWELNLESFIKFAKGEMYMNRLKSGMGAVVKEESAPGEYYKAFNLLIEKNLFSYHFQPIVSIKDGSIYGYEALMRTDKSIGMNPLEVLEAAREYNRLYEIEKATMYNIMQHYSARKDEFCGKKVFINTIPGYFLKDQDMQQLITLHGSYMDSFIFELTEQNTVSDDELNAIRNFSGGEKSGRIAIDDYGTGHSNMANLLRYAPRIIKIDRFLIENIHRNQNKQLFVRSTVEFAKLNGILVLAEGVETSNELHTVIDLGVDLAQGYYLGRPVPDPIAEISRDIQREILEANPLFGQDRS